MQKIVGLLHLQAPPPLLALLQVVDVARKVERSLSALTVTDCLLQVRKCYLAAGRGATWLARRLKAFGSHHY